MLGSGRQGWRVLGWEAPEVKEGMQRKGAPLVAGAGEEGAQGWGLQGVGALGLPKLVPFCVQD